MSLDRLVLHVGYPKTATSWLQAQVFGQAAQGFAVPWPTAGNRIIEAVGWTNPRAFDPDAVRAAFVADLAQLPADAVPVISYETLVGDPTRQIFWGFEVASRLHAAFPMARVLISIREQGALAVSTWQEYVVRGGTLDLPQFLFRGGLAETGYRAACPPEYFRFADLVAHYQALFGKDRVGVLPLELLRRAPDDYAAALFAFCGTGRRDLLRTEPVYPSKPAAQLALQRLANRCLSFDTMPTERRARWRQRIGRLARRLPSGPFETARDRAATAARAAVRADVAADNARLAALTGLDLKGFGYAVPDDRP